MTTASRSRQASVKVLRPTHVPKELHPVWHEAASHLARSGRLLTASNKVNYDAVNTHYLRVLGASIQMGRKAAKKRLAANQPQVPMNARDVAIATPGHVAKELRPVWFAAARHASKQGKLLNEHRQINYHEINRNYVKALSAYVGLGQRAASKRPALKNWPFQDISPNDIGRMAAQGRWDLVNKAARMASSFFARAPITTGRKRSSSRRSVVASNPNWEGILGQISNDFKRTPFHDLVELEWNADSEGATHIEFMTYEDRPDASPDSAQKAAKWWSNQLKTHNIEIQGMSNKPGNTMLYVTAPPYDDPSGA